MRITAIRIIPFDTGTRGGKIRAFADVELDGVMILKGIRVLEGRSGGLFIGLPSQRGRDGSYRDIVSLTDKSFADEFRRNIIEAYRNSEEFLENRPEGGKHEQ